MPLSLSDKANIRNTSKFWKSHNNFSFLWKFEPLYQIFPEKFSSEKRKIFTKNDELINASATEQFYSF